MDLMICRKTYARALLIDGLWTVGVRQWSNSVCAAVASCVESTTESNVRHQHMQLQGFLVRSNRIPRGINRV